MLRAAEAFDRKPLNRPRRYSAGRGSGRSSAASGMREEMVEERTERAAAMSWRARKRTRDALPRRINEALKMGRALLKEAKGLKG